MYSTKGLSSHPNPSSTCDVVQNCAQNIAHQAAVSMILFLEFHAIYSKVVWYKSAKPKVIDKNAKDSSLGNLGLVQ